MFTPKPSCATSRDKLQRSVCWRQRRFRSLALGADASPEGFARRLNGDLLRDGERRELARRIDALTPAGLVELANALGSPRILYFGPDLADRQ